jgi:hypothetical protein
MELTLSVAEGKNDAAAAAATLECCGKKIH